MMISRRTNTPPAASKVHFRDAMESLLPESDIIFGNSLEIPTTHHPRISVVIVVDTAWTTYGVLMNFSRRKAPSVPNRYPKMLATMIIAAVNSMFRFFLKHTSKTIVIVSRVSNSSSSIPAILQLKATTACRMAKKWIIHAGFILEYIGIRFVFWDI